MGVLLLKKWRKSAIFCAFLRATGVLVFLLSRCMCGGVGLCRCVVVVGGFVFCVMCCVGGFSGNRVSSCS